MLNMGDGYENTSLPNFSPSDSEVLLPEKPVEPLDSECCGTGCSPCVFDIYKKQLTKWEIECESIRRTGASKRQASSGSGGPQSETIGSVDFITPYEYKLFKVVDIFEDAVDSVRIFKFDCTPETNEDDITIIHYSDNTFPVEIGQHVVIKSGQVSRKYTVLRVTKGSGSTHFEILIEMYPEGRLTQLLNQVSIGCHLEIRGPFGNCYEYRPNTFGSLVMLVAGTGLAPMYRIIERILGDENDEIRIKLFFSCRNVDEIFLRTKLQHWESFWNFKTFYYFSLQSASKSRIPYGMSAKLDRLGLDEIREKCSKELRSIPMKVQFLLCGTKSFEKDMINYLRTLNVPEDLVRVF